MIHSMAQSMKIYEIYEIYDNQWKSMNSMKQPMEYLSVASLAPAQSVLPCRLPIGSSGWKCLKTVPNRDDWIVQFRRRQNSSTTLSCHRQFSPITASPDASATDARRPRRSERCRARPCSRVSTPRKGATSAVAYQALWRNDFDAGATIVAWLAARPRYIAQTPSADLHLDSDAPAAPCAQARSKPTTTRSGKAAQVSAAELDRAVELVRRAKGATSAVAYSSALAE